MLIRSPAPRTACGPLALDGRFLVDLNAQETPSVHECFVQTTGHVAAALISIIKIIKRCLCPAVQTPTSDQQRIYEAFGDAIKLLQTLIRFQDIRFPCFPTSDCSFNVTFTDFSRFF